MSRITYEGNEMQTISMHDEISPLTPLMSNPSNGNVSSNQESSNFRKSDDREQYGLSRNSSMQSGAHPRKNSTKISYLNEKELNLDKSHFQGQKPDPVFIPGKGHYKESSFAYQPFNVRRPEIIHRAADNVLCNNQNPRLINGTRPVKALSPSRIMDRPTQYHTFLADAADVRQIEDGLLKLMEEFQTGNLRAFGKDSRLRQMEEIREQQERLAKLHFDVGAEQDSYPPLSEDGLRISDQNMKTLMEKLADLSESIENLHTNSTERKISTNERKRNSQSGLANGQSDHRNNAFPLLNGEKEHTKVGSNAKVEIHSVRPEPNQEGGTEHQPDTVLLRKT